MKILLCSSTFQSITHGPAKFAHLLLEINDRYPECEVRILTEEIDQPIPDRIYKITPKYPRLLHAFWPFLNNYSYYQAAIHIYKSYPFDVLLFNNAIMGYWAAKKNIYNFKVVGMVNDDDYLSAFLSQFSFRKKWLINFHRKFLERLACKHQDKVIVNSDYIRNLILKNYPCAAEKVFKLYKSVDLEHFSFTSPKAIKEDQYIKILFVKSDYPRGGLKLLIDALDLLPYFFELTIIGPKEKELKIINSFFKTKNRIQINFKGPTDQDIVRKALNEHDIFCVPAHKEGLGVANIEALASGIPVVSTRVGGIPEVLDQGRNGWLSSEDKPEALAKALQACLENPQERAKRSIQGRNFVEKHFNHQNMLKNLLKNLMG